MNDEEAVALKDAIELAVKAHEGQKDLSGKAYILHPMRVMASLGSYGATAMIVGVLHDVVEDTKITLKEIEEVFGKEVADGVDAVSRREGEDYFEYIRRAAQHPIGKLVKAADLRDNMLPERTQGLRLKSLLGKYSKALDILR